MELEDAGQDRHSHQQADGAGRLAGLQARERERAVRDELAGGNPDHARDRKHEHQREREQRIDGTVGDAILHQQGEDLQIHVGGESADALARSRKRPAAHDAAAGRSWAA